MPVLTAKNLHYRYLKGTPYEKQAVSDLSFTVEPGEILGIIGHTGSGKSTLMQLLGGLLTPDAGTVLVEDTDIFADPKALRAARFRVGLVFQYPEYQLFDETVAADIGFGPRNMGLSEEAVADRVKRAAALVQLPEALLEKSPFDLSGGEKRRAAIAGILAMEPEVLILDEPTAGLDPRGRQVILDLIRTYHDQTGAAVLFVSHNMEDVAALADRVLVLSNGKRLMWDTADRVFANEDLLRSVSLDIPAVARILSALRRRGHALPEGITSVEQAVEALLALKKAGDGTC